MARAFAFRSVRSGIHARFLVVLIASAASFAAAPALAQALPAQPASAASATASVSGAIFDPLGAAVPGATVTLLRDAQSVSETTTDRQGGYTFRAVDEGRYQLRVAAPGFAPRTLDPFFVGSAGHVAQDVTLQVGLQQDVVVTASATEVPASQVGAPVTVLDQDTLDALAKPDVLEALRLVPGEVVNQTGGHGGLTSLYVRGGNSDFNKVLIDGVPANDIGGAFDFSEVTTTGVDRVEVLRDANSVLYGNDALAGVVDITTKQGTTRIPELTVSADGGSLGTSREDASFGGAVKRFDYFSELSHFDTNNDVPNNAYRNDTFASRFGWMFGSATHLSGTVRRMTSRYGSPNGFDLYGIADDSSQTADATYVNVTADTQVNSRWQTTLRFASMEQGYHTINPSPTGEPFDPFDSGFPNYLGHVVTLCGANGYCTTGQAILDYSGTFPSTYDAHTTRNSGDAQATGHLATGLDLSAGLHVDHESGTTNYTGAPSISSATRTNAGAFTELRASVHRVFASAGLGYDHDAVFKSAVTPRLSAAAYLRNPPPHAAIGDTKLTFNIGTGIKAPSIAQQLSSLYALVQELPPDTISSTAAAALSPIGPERSRSIDVGVEQAFWNGRASARVSYFDNAFSDLIEYVSNTALPQLGIPTDVANATGFGAYVNSSSYWARGVETSADVRINAMLRVTGSYTYLHAVVTKSFASSALDPAFNPAFPDIPIGAYGPLVGAAPFRRPANTGSLFITFTRGAAQVALAGSFVGKSDDSTFLSDGYFGNTMLLPNQDLDPAYQKLDLSASYRVTPRLRAYVSIENLTNEQYVASFGFPALPRTFRAGATLRLGGDRP